MWPNKKKKQEQKQPTLVERLTALTEETNDTRYVYELGKGGNFSLQNPKDVEGLGVYRITGFHYHTPQDGDLLVVKKGGHTGIFELFNVKALYDPEDMFFASAALINEPTAAATPIFAKYKPKP